MTISKYTISEQSLISVLLFAIAILLVAIYQDYSPDLFNEFEYALSQSLGNFDAAIAKN